MSYVTPSLTTMSLDFPFGNVRFLSSMIVPGYFSWRCIGGVGDVVGTHSQKFFRIFFYLSYMKTINTFKPKNKVNRPGIHAKTKTSKNKKSKLYKKAYRGQGR